MNTTKCFFAACATLAIATIGCGGTQSGNGGAGGTTAEAKEASAVIEGKSGTSTTGGATFTSDGKNVTLKLEVTGAPAGEHAVHIHVNPDCSSPDAESAGDHWNPTHEAHGKFGTEPFHLGDIGNMTVGADGKGSISLTTDLWSIGTGQVNDVTSHSIVIHASPDDLASQPSGNAGTRIGCGVIKRM